LLLKQGASTATSKIEKQISPFDELLVTTSTATQKRKNQPKPEKQLAALNPRSSSTFKPVIHYIQKQKQNLDVKKKKERGVYFLRREAKTPNPTRITTITTTKPMIIHISFDNPPIPPLEVGVGVGEGPTVLPTGVKTA
jgi:hypothetical protein